MRNVRVFAAVAAALLAAACGGSKAPAGPVATGCTATTCAAQGKNCGSIPDGCGGSLQCGTCLGGQTCGGGGNPNVCGAVSSCTPTTCAAQGKNCGAILDGCGGTLDCGSCPSGQSCGGGGAANMCGVGCSDLVAVPGAAIELRFDTGTHSICALATSNPDGQVDLGIQNVGEMSFDLDSPDGAAHQGSIAPVSFNNLLDIDPWFHWTGAGYAGLDEERPPHFRTWSSTGVVLATGQDAAVSSAPDGHGGSVVLARSFDPNATPSLGPTQLQWVNASGVVSRSVVLDEPPGVPACELCLAGPNVVEVSWNTGDVLTIIAMQPKSLARWFDGAGTPLTPWFDAGEVSAGGSFHLLVDGSIAVSDGQTWLALFRDGVAQVDPPPDWLAARPGTRLATIRQGRGYAVLPSLNMPTIEADPTRFEIVTASGESCGNIALPPSPGDADLGASPSRLDVGQDGTALQTEFFSSPNLGSGIHCAFRWWPALLK